MNIDLIPNGAIKRVHVSQNDVGRTLTFELFNNSTSYTIPSGATVKIQGTKPSGFGFSETCTVSGNTVTVDTTEEMTDEFGYIDTELQIKYNDNTIGTSNFVLAIEKNPHPDTITDGSTATIIPELTLLVNEVKGYAEEIENTYHAYGSPWVASTVAQMTDTDKIYVYTGSETGYVNGNWYYYNGSSWVSGGVYNAVAVNIDPTLSIQGACADAKAVGVLKASLDAVESTFDEKIQLLFENEWIQGQYYAQNSTNIGNAGSYRRYPPFTLKAGKYYYYHIHPMFTNIVSEHITITNLLNYSGTTQITNYDTGYFTIPEDVTIYISTHFASSSMLSLYEQNVNNYVEGIYDIAPKYEDLFATNVELQNEALSNILNVPTTNLVVWSDGELHQTSPSSGNAGWRQPVDVTKLKNNIVVLNMNIRAITGTGSLYIFGTSTSNAGIITKVREITTVGEQTDTFDLNYYVVYENLDLSKPVAVGVYNKTSDFDCYYTKVDTYTITTELDVNKDLNDNLNDMYSNIEANKNAISVLEGSTYLKSPNGSKFVIRVSDSGVLSAVRIIPNKVLFVGNSLLIGNGTFGMCATDNQHDYYYHVTNEITSQNANATYDKLSGTTFEGATNESTANTWMSGTLLSHLASDLDLVVIQLGDNVNTEEKVTAFAQNCINLIQYVNTHSPNARVAWVGEWYSTATKQNIIAQACASTGSVFVDISDLVTSANKANIGDVVHKTTSSTTTYAIDSYTDDASNKILTITFTVNNVQYTSELPYTSYTTATGTITVTGYYTLVNNTGVASHPGNTGMLAIANRICYKLGLIDEEGDIA